MHTWTKNKYLQLFANCIPVRGAKRSIICDLNRASYEYIPNDLFYLVNKFERTSKEVIYNSYKIENHQILDEYFIFLEAKEFIFWCDLEESNFFPKLELSFRVPYEITNSIIDVDPNSDFDIKIFISQIIEMNCPHVQIRSYAYNDFNFWQSILDLFKYSSVRSLEIFSKWNDLITIDDILTFVENNQRITLFVCYSSIKQTRYVTKTGIPVIFLSQKLESSKHCGQISSSYFAPNINFFSESKNFNTCLNRKISIDVNGDIKNCPSMAKSYGNIKDTTLAEAIEKPGFKDMWFINKDQIAVCKDCEFRYICTDCRAYIENPEDIYSKPLKCGYNPYTAEWEEWSTNPLKQKAIEYYGMQELVKKEK